MSLKWNNKTSRLTRFRNHATCCWKMQTACVSARGQWKKGKSEGNKTLSLSSLPCHWDRTFPDIQDVPALGAVTLQRERCLPVNPGQRSTITFFLFSGFAQLWQLGAHHALVPHHLVLLHARMHIHTHTQKLECLFLQHFLHIKSHPPKCKALHKSSVF